MITVLIVFGVWLLVAILGDWIIAQCIGAMEEPDPIEEQTIALLKRINEEIK